MPDRNEQTGRATNPLHEAIDRLEWLEGRISERLGLPQLPPVDRAAIARDLLALHRERAQPAGVPDLGPQGA